MTISEKIQAEINWIYAAISADNGNYMYNLNIMTDALNHIAKDVERMEAKADKYRWHDLRKNPEDLPPKCDAFVDEKKQVEIVCRNGEHYYACYVEYREDCKVWKVKHQKTYASAISKPIAWREIDPFEEVE